MRESKKPIAVANNLIKLLDIVLGVDRYPVDLKWLALEYSREKFPNAYIEDITDDDLPGFEGALYKKVKNNSEPRWLIIYNNQIIKPERINFTLAHEFGHYLLHRDEEAKFECSQENLSSFYDYAEREVEANRFAAQLLMPIHDFREQVNGCEFNFELMEHCTNRYQASLTAVVLKWIEFTSKRAIIVVSRDGFILWTRSSTPAFKSGVYIKTVDSPPVPIPEKSLASQRSNFHTTKVEFQHPAGVWWEDESVKELTVFPKKFDIVLTLLLFSDETSNRLTQYEEEDTEDLWEPPRW